MSMQWTKTMYTNSTFKRIYTRARARPFWVFLSSYFNFYYCSSYFFRTLLLHNLFHTLRYLQVFHLCRSVFSLSFVIFAHFSRFWEKSVGILFVAVFSSSFKSIHSIVTGWKMPEQFLHTLYQKYRNMGAPTFTCFNSQIEVNTQHSHIKCVAKVKEDEEKKEIKNKTESKMNGHAMKMGLKQNKKRIRRRVPTANTHTHSVEKNQNSRKTL